MIKFLACFYDSTESDCCHPDVVMNHTLKFNFNLIGKALSGMLACTQTCLVSLIPINNIELL